MWKGTADGADAHRDGRKHLRTPGCQGDRAEEGDTLLLLDSMKMELPVLAEGAGTVSRLAVVKGDVVQEGDLLDVVE